MMYKWYPDTCRCIFKDNGEAVFLCPQHKNYQEALRDNLLKSRIIEILLQYKALPASFVENGMLRKEINFKYYFDNGKIVFSLEGGILSPLQKSNIEAVLNHVIPNQYEFKDIIVN